MAVVVLLGDWWSYVLWARLDDGGGSRVPMFDLSVCVCVCEVGSGGGGGEVVEGGEWWWVTGEWGKWGVSEGTCGAPRDLRAL